MRGKKTLTSFNRQVLKDSTLSKLMPFVVVDAVMKLAKWKSNLAVDAQCLMSFRIFGRLCNLNLYRRQLDNCCSFQPV